MIHAASQSTANGNMTTRNGSGIGYTSYNLPNLIMSGSNSSTLSYGANRNRYKQVSVASGAYVDGLAAVRATGFSYVGSSLGGRTALAVALAGGAAWLAYTGADLAVTAACERGCGW